MQQITAQAETNFRSVGRNTDFERQYRQPDEHYFAGLLDTANSHIQSMRPHELDEHGNNHTPDGKTPGHAHGSSNDVQQDQDRNLSESDDRSRLDDVKRPGEKQEKADDHVKGQREDATTTGKSGKMQRRGLMITEPASSKPVKETVTRQQGSSARGGKLHSGVTAPDVESRMRQLLAGKAIAPGSLTVATKGESEAVAETLQPLPGEAGKFDLHKASVGVITKATSVLEEVELSQKGGEPEALESKPKVNSATGKSGETNTKAETSTVVNRLLNQPYSFVKELTPRGIRQSKLTSSVAKTTNGAGGSEPLYEVQHNPTRKSATERDSSKSKSKDNNDKQSAASLSGNTPEKFDIRGSREVVRPNSQPGGNTPEANSKTTPLARVHATQIAQALEKITAITNQQLSQRGSKLEVALDLKDIGRVSVDAQKQMDKIHLQIRVESSEVRRLMENHIRPIVEQLAKNGLEIGKMEVSVKGDEGQRPDENSFGGSNSRDNLGFANRGRQTLKRDRKQVKLSARAKQQTGSNQQTLEIWA